MNTKEENSVVSKRLVEAILFASAEPLSPTQILPFMPDEGDIDIKRIRDILKTLQHDYAERGVNLLEIEGKWVFRTASDLSELMDIEKQVHKKLSRAAMETLSIIAYHQPVTRAEIENIRGVSTNKGTLDTLMELGWVKPGRRRETLGRPLTWVTTTDFLDHFALESLIDLPGMDEMKSAGLLDRRPAIETVNQDDLFAGLNDEKDSEQEAGSGQKDKLSVEREA
ncbi:MAG: SMC-Scp complex subunit ScpB [Alphaproteobacteria bacterium]|nr:SMC-Scp complex subunit ScpB [Alphaproteobacteria bacterium]